MTFTCGLLLRPGNVLPFISSSIENCLRKTFLLEISKMDTNCITYLFFTNCKYIEANTDVIEVELFEVVLQSTISLLSAC